MVYVLLQHKAQEHTMNFSMWSWVDITSYDTRLINEFLEFENAAIQALRRVIGQDLHVQGCFYHLTQST